VIFLEVKKAYLGCSVQKFSQKMYLRLQFKQLWYTFFLSFSQFRGTHFEQAVTG